MTPDTTSPGLTWVLPPQKDLEGLPVLSHTHMYTQARTWRDCLCCHTNTHVHMIEDLEGPHELSHTHMYTQART